MITVSIISHGHGAMVSDLILKLLNFPEISKIILVKNIPESISFQKSHKIQLIENLVPLGFGANHNLAFENCLTRYFCPLNPDIIFLDNIFPHLLDIIEINKATLVAPLVLNDKRIIEDSIRHFPSIFSILKKIFIGNDGTYNLKYYKNIIQPEWVAGMFMLFVSDHYKILGGFDEHFFLYYEDVDICVRIRQKGFKIIACLDCTIVHNARRDSRIKLHYLYWHILSMIKFFYKHWKFLASNNH